MDITNGIDFKQKDLPPFVESLSGLSFPEKFGRWTDTFPGQKATIAFKNPLPADVTLKFYVHEAYGPNTKRFSRIVVGNEEKQIKPADTDLVYTFPVRGLKDIRTIEIYPAAPTKPSEYASPPSGDTRNLGIMFTRLLITKGIDE